MNFSLPNLQACVCPLTHHISLVVLSGFSFLGFVHGDGYATFFVTLGRPGIFSEEDHKKRTSSFHIGLGQKTVLLD